MPDMKLWSIEASVDDDPYVGTGHALVFAPNKTQAKKEGKRAIIAAYNNSAGGWSHKPLIREWEYPTAVEEVPFPTETTTLLATCASDR